MHSHTLLISGFVLALGIILSAFMNQQAAQFVETDLISEYPSGKAPMGVVYCDTWLDPQAPWRALAADGTVTTLPPGVSGEPSRTLHAGHRWFLRVQELPGQEGPDGAPRRELFAVRDDGRSVQLTDQPDLQPSPHVQPRWPIHGGDQLVSWVARRWEAGRVIEGGIYTAVVRFDSEGLVAGLIDHPEVPAITIPLTQVHDTDGWYRAVVPDICSFDWSPDGSAVVYDSFEEQIRVGPATQEAGSGRTGRPVSTGSFRLLTAERACDPVWSPDGSRIAFKCCRFLLGPIVTIRADGVDPRPIVSPDPADPFTAVCPAWSPDGKYLAYQRIGGKATALRHPSNVDVYVTGLDGAEHINLTADTRAFSRVVAWR